MKWMTKTSITAVLAFAVFIVLTACMPGMAESAEREASRSVKLAAIKSIVATGEGKSAELVIKLSTPVTYTSYKTTAPLRLVVDLSQATQGSVTAPVAVNKGNFKSVKVSRYDTDAGVLTRIEIGLVNDGEAVITPSSSDPSELRVSFPVINEVASAPPAKNDEPKTKPDDDAKPTSADPPVSAQAEPAVPASDAGSARSLTSIIAKNNTIILALDGSIGEFKAFRLNKPERFIVDLMEVKSALATRLLSLNAAGVASARIGVYPDKTRVVFDSVNGSFPEASAVKSDSAVVITLDVKPLSNGSGTKPQNDDSQASSAKASAPVKEKHSAGKTESTSAVESAEDSPKKTAKKAKYAGPPFVESIDFQVLDGISRVSVKVQGGVTVEPPVKSAGFVTLTVKNASIQKSLQRSLEAGSFISPVLRVTPVMIKNKRGNDIKIKIAMRTSATFDFRHEGDMLFVDFKNPEGLTAEKLASETGGRKMQVQASQPKASSSEPDIFSELVQAADPNQKTRGYKGSKVTLEFADAEVRKIFQLLSEVSKKNFVLGDDVTGTISLKLVNVPWDQALEIILDTKELELREVNNVLTIKKKGKFGSQEAADAELKKKREAAETDLKKTAELNLPLQPTKVFSVNYATLSEVTTQLKNLSSGPDGAKIRTDSSVISDSRTNMILVIDTQDRLNRMQSLLTVIDVPEKQVMIEARIVEASTSFTRNLGVNWGLHKTMGNNLPFPGLNQANSGFGGLTSYAPPSGAGTVGSVPGGQLGMMFGTLTAGVELDMRLNAAASAQLIKIISSPKVATLNHKTAKISQGVQIPYQNTTATTGAVTAFVAATLSLEVTPHINANGTIVMKIDAKNDAPGTGSPPPINTKQATTEMLLRDGETTVIGGIFVESETEGDTGVPFLMDVPLFGNLFKSTEKLKSKNELLIFITPRLLDAQ